MEENRDKQAAPSIDSAALHAKNYNMSPIKPGSGGVDSTTANKRAQKPKHRSFRLTPISHPKKAEIIDTSDTAESSTGLRSTTPLNTARVVAPKKKKKLEIGWVTASERILFIDNLSTMLKAGLSLAPALHTLNKQVKNKYFQKIIIYLEDHVENGQLFSDGMKQYPKVFNEMIISTVEVGESTGKLPETLADLASILKAQKKLKSKILGALMYPSVVLLALIGVSLFLAFFVFPQIVTIFIESGVELPFILRSVQFITEFFKNYSWYILAGIVAFFLIFGIIFRQPKPKLFLHRNLLKLPFAGNLLKEISLTRFALNLNTLLTAGLSIVRSLQIVSQTIGNLRYRQVIALMSKELEKGISLEKSMADRSDLFPSLAVQLVSVGEKTGELDSVLERIGSYYEERVSNVLTNMTVIIEPVLLVIVGVAVAFIALSIIGPLYELTNSFAE